MLTAVLGSVAAVLVLLVLFGLAKSVVRYDKLSKDLNDRLENLEDRFYHPANYKEAFFRPLSKKKDDAKES
jgi:hypothetical protein